MSDLQKKLRALGLEIVWQTPERLIVWSEAARKEFSDADETRQNRILAVCRLWCDGHNLTTEQHNRNERRAQRGKINKRMEAFKTHKVRLYGYERALFGKRTFVAVACDPQKKSNRAKDRILTVALGRIVDLEEHIGDGND